jgi:diguanylate cyclase (GGDEF)-like protein
VSVAATSPTPIVPVPAPHPSTVPIGQPTSSSHTPTAVTIVPTLIGGATGVQPTGSGGSSTSAGGTISGPFRPLVTRPASFPRTASLAAASARDASAPLGAPAGGSHLRTQTQPSLDEFLRIERVVPAAIWIALALALALAAVNGGAAVWSGYRVRRQATRLTNLRAAALTDALTGVLNRRGFTEAAERELARARRHDRPFTIAYVDVRSLKVVNDTEGHRAGDELLRQTARLLTGAARADDVVGRLGGDELAMMLVEQDATGAEVVQQRIAEEVTVRRSAIGLRANWDLTVGTATYPQDGETVEALLRCADTRLYQQRGITLS